MQKCPTVLNKKLLLQLHNWNGCGFFLLYRGITVRGIGGWKGPAPYCFWSYMAWRTTETFCTNVCAFERTETCSIRNQVIHTSHRKKTSLEDLRTVDGQNFAIVSFKFIWPRFAQWRCHRSSPGLQTTAECASKGLSHRIRCQDVKEDYE